ncbi:PepSY domain-containing protein [Streptomyces sp. NPDC096132]|uniref:PepSY domain-containing protein n=1 Tax=Streptomyces sp. NPDC096132 TaxID=3366075 RepID=UPI003828DBC0
MKRKLVIAAVATSVVIGAGTAVAFAEGGTRTGATETRVADARTVTTTDTDTDVRVTPAKTGVAEAIAAALRHTPGTAVGADREDDGADAGRWHVDVVKGDGTAYTVTVSPDTGRALGAHRDTDDDGDDAAEGLEGTDVDVLEAVRAVAAKDTVTDVDLDDAGRATIWSVDTAQDGEWTVDARTGKVTQDVDD